MRLAGGLMTHDLSISKLRPCMQQLGFCTGNNGVVDVYCKTIHLLDLSSIPMQTSVNLFLLVSKHKFFEQNAFLVICQCGWEMSKNLFESLFSHKYKLRAILCSNSYFCSASCLTLTLTKQLRENSLPHNAWLNLPRWNPSSLLVHWLVSQTRARVPVSTWVHQLFLFLVTRSMRKANK